MRRVGRRLFDDDALVPAPYANPECARRRQILRETLSRFEARGEGARLKDLAQENLARWKREATGQVTGRVTVLPGDWGVVTHALTREHGACFAVLNMANAFKPGGGYVEGAVAQEENMYRRSDCHFHVKRPHFDPDRDRYTPEATRLLSGEDGVVYLDTEHPRVCIRGPEDRSADDLGYAWLAPGDVFPFYELKAAAQDLRRGGAFDSARARRQIRAQLTTLRAASVRHVVLGAFGCGAFRNPATEVARIYRDELAGRRADFDVVAFAVFHAGYGPDNFTPFHAAFEGF